MVFARRRSASGTLATGKYEADYDGVMTPGPVDIGFDVHFGVPGNHNDRFERYVIGDSIYRPLSIEPGAARIDDPARPAEPVERIDDLVDTTLTAQACEFIHDCGDRPFFLYLTYCATHTHITPRVDFRGRSRVGQLGDYMMELDSHVGEIIEQSRKQGIANDTLVMFTSDNGGQENDVKGAGSSLTLGDNRATLRSRRELPNGTLAPSTAIGRMARFAVTKVASTKAGSVFHSMARWPAHIEAGIETEAVFSLVDLFATVANLVDDEPRYVWRGLGGPKPSVARPG